MSSQITYPFILNINVADPVFYFFIFFFLDMNFNFQPKRISKLVVLNL